MNKINFNNIFDYLKIIFIILLLIYNIIVYLFYYYKFKFNNQRGNTYNINFEYHKYQRNIITNKIKINAGWQITMNQAYFINGLIRKLQLKKCLEIGVANGGSSILILNAIKDINESYLVSLDLNEQSCTNNSKKTGYRVKEYFPELFQKWKLYTGDLPYKFLDKLKMKFDFVFIDSAHESPGEILNLIEVLPFLNNNAIIAVHDIMWHLTRKAPSPPVEVKFTPSSIYLISCLYGDKIIIKNNSFESGIENLGVAFLYNSQESHYIDYFLLLNSFWEYMPSDKQIYYLRKYIQKYYKKEIFIKLFDHSVKYNKIYINKFNKFRDNCLKKNNIQI